MFSSSQASALQRARAQRDVEAVHAMPRKEACDQLGQDVGGLAMQTNAVSLWSPLGIDIACMVSVAAFERELGQVW